MSKLNNESKYSKFNNNNNNNNNNGDNIEKEEEKIVFGKNSFNSLIGLTDNQNKSIPKTSEEIREMDLGKKLSDSLRKKYNIKQSDCGVGDFKNLQAKIFELKNKRRNVILII